MNRLQPMWLNLICGSLRRTSCHLLTYSCIINRKNEHILSNSSSNSLIMFRPREKVKPYHYFDSPDGEDLFKKLWAVLKPTSLVALGASTVDVLLHSHPKGYMKTLGRFVHVSAPFFGMATAFVLVTNMSAKARDKDDKLNWFIGGASAGAVLGAWYRSSVGAVVGGFAFGLAAVVKKAAVENDIDIFPVGFTSAQPSKQWANLWEPDYTLTRERPGRWVTEPNEEEEEEEIVDLVADAEEGYEEEDAEEEEFSDGDFEDEDD